MKVRLHLDQNGLRSLGRLSSLTTGDEAIGVELLDLTELAPKAQTRSASLVANPIPLLHRVGEVDSTLANAAHLDASAITSNSESGTKVLM